MSVRTVKLEDVCDVTDGTHYTPPNSGGPFPFLTVKDMTEDGLAFKGCSYVTEAEFAKAKSMRACPSSGDVLFSKDGTVGKVHIVSSDKPFAVLSSIAILRPNRTRLHSGFLGYALRNPAILRDATDRKTGSALQRIILGDLKEVSIPLPDLPEQKRIAGLLEQADELRRTRRYALELSDTFLPAAFLGLFGDPIKNDKGWHIAELGEYIDFLTSGSRGWASYYTEQGDIFIRIQNVGRGRLLLDGLTYVAAPLNAEATRTLVKPGDVLLSITADLGRSAAIPDGFPPAYINQHLALIRQTKLNPVFLATLLSCDAAKTKWGTIDRDAVKSGLNFDDIRRFHVIAPPISVQLQYAALESRHERLRANQRETLRQADHLFQSLLHRAFAPA